MATPARKSALLDQENVLLDQGLLTIEVHARISSIEQENFYKDFYNLVQVNL